MTDGINTYPRSVRFPERALRHPCASCGRYTTRAWHEAQKRLHGDDEAEYPCPFCGEAYYGVDEDEGELELT